MRGAGTRGRCLVGAVCFSLSALSVGAEIASFTGSNGRTVLYQYSLKPEWDPNVPRGVLIYFHGNNTATQRAVLRGFFASRQRQAYLQDLVPVVVASPEARVPGVDARLQRYKVAPHTGYGTRFWGNEDQSLIQELLQGEFEGAFRVDFDRVVFWGGSQGPCFLNDFVQRYGDDYGGGFLANCGCFEGRDPLWRPGQGFRDGFRVFVRAATGDFLHTHSLQAYGYYRYVVGLETRGDLGRAGGHCRRGDVSDEAAIEWLLHGTGLPEAAEESDEAHFERVAVMDRIVAITADSDGTLWVARQPSQSHPASLWRSVDRGNTYEPVSRTRLLVADLDAVDGALILTAKSREYAWLPEVSFHRSTDGGTEFSLLDLKGGEVSSAGTTTDRHQRIYVLVESSQEGHPEILRSSDLGESWTTLAPAGTRYSELIVDPLATEEQEGYLFLKRWAGSVEWVGSTSGNDWRRVGETPAGPPEQATWDGATIWGVAGRCPRVYASVDHGSTWEEMSMPKAATITFGSCHLPGITALGDGELLLIGGGYEGFLLDAGSREWRHVLGGAAIAYRGATIWDGRYPARRLAVDHLRGDVFVTDGRGILRLGGDVRGSDPFVPSADADGDGIPDRLDAFPHDPGEFLDTDGDGIGNARDRDDDGDGVPDLEDGVALDASESVDTDADGVGDGQDQDDDGDGVWDLRDAFPLDRREQADSDGDGVGDWADDDDDGDGVADAEDAFPLYPQEWSDADGDGVGDNIDPDDDNDGIADAEDPLVSELASRATLEPADSSVLWDHRFPWQERSVPVGRVGWVGVRYPQPLGARQEYGHLTLGDGPDPRIHFMIDYLDDVPLVYLDRNDNGDLTDDGPPEELKYGNDWSYVEVAYSSGLVLPYGVHYGHLRDPVIGFGGAWIGDVEVGGSPVAVLTVDYDIDGLFDGVEDYVCVDTDRDRRLACRDGDASELFRTGDTIQLDGQAVRVNVATSGHKVELRPVTHFVSTFPPASHPTRQGFVRVINHGDHGGLIEIEAVDDKGAMYRPVTLMIGAGQTAHFNSDDIEKGNRDKGLSGGVGAGVGTWRLELRSDLDIEVLSYIRTADGFVTSMHDLVIDRAGVYRVPFFNPGSNLEQVSLLRLVNPGEDVASVSIRGVDDSGWLSTPVEITMPARTARTLAASDLESGTGVQGALGDGRGKWQLHVTSSRYIRVMSLMESPSGHLTNLSADAWNRGARQFVSAFPPSAHQEQQGFVRIINHSGRAGLVEVEPIDDEGTRYGPLRLAVGARETLHFNSDDLERGNPEKGLAPGVGVGVGMWRLELSSDLDIETLSYIRHADGFLTSAHDLVAGYGGVYRAPFLNPGSNEKQVSRLRLVNPHASGMSVSVRGVDDTGWSSPAVEVGIPPLASRTLSASDLESGMGLQGALGEGNGKWQLRVASPRDVRVMSLLESPTDHLTNLSTTLRLPATTRNAIRAPHAGPESWRVGPITRETFVHPGAEFDIAGDDLFMYSNGQVGDIEPDGMSQ